MFFAWVNAVRSSVLIIGVLSWALGASTVLANPPKAAAGVPLLTFIFDDGNETDYSVARGIFAAEGAVACSAVVTDRVDQPGFLKASQLVELQQQGWEILSHTVSHPRLNELTDERLEFELSQSRARLEALGVSVKNLVYPMNMNNERVRSVARKYYRSSRGGTNQLNTGNTDPYWLKSFRITPSLEQMKPLVDQAHAEGRWLIIYLHNIDVRLELTHRHGEFARAEEVEFTPSGARGMFSWSRWLWAFDGYHFIPGSGPLPQPGDRLRGLTSGATAEARAVAAPMGDELRELLKYVRSRYADMAIVTVDQGLDMLEPQAWANGATQGAGSRPGG